MYYLDIQIQKNEFTHSGKVLNTFKKYKDFQEKCPDINWLPDLLFDCFFKDIKSWLDCSQIYMFARAQFTPDKYDYVTCNLNDKPEIAQQEVKDFFRQICRFFEGRKMQVVQTIWQAYDGAANVVMNFYYKAD